MSLCSIVKDTEQDHQINQFTGGKKKTSNNQVDRILTGYTTFLYTKHI